MTAHRSRTLRPAAAVPPAGGVRAGTEIGGGILIVVAVLLAFWPSLGGGFLWDDEHWIAATPSTPTHRLIHDADGLFRIWFRGEAEDYWPLSNSMFWLEWRWWGMNPTGYRAVNLGLHALGAVLVWRVLRTLRVSGAWLGAMLFAVHPVTVASVAWIAELKNCLSLPLFAAALLFWLWFDETGRRRWYAASLAAFFLALAAKTSTVALPLVLLSCCWWRRGRITRQDLARSVPFFLLALAMGSVTLVLQASHGAVPGEPEPDGVLSRLAASGWVVWFYLAKAVVPLRLAMLYPRWHVDPATLVAWLPLAALCGAAVVIRWLDPRWSRPFTMALGCYAVMLGPVLGIINMWFRRYALVSDHLQYLALPAITALLAAGLATATRNPRTRPLASAAAAALVLAFGALTWQRSAVFCSTIALMEDSLAKNPDSWTARTNLGAALVNVGRTPEAIAHYREALRLLPTSAEAHNNLGNALFQLGRPQEAIPHYQESLRIKPGVAGVHSNLGIALGLLGNLQEAVPHFQEVVRLTPTSAEARNNLGHALALQGRLAEAVVHYEEAVRLNPDNQTARDNLSRCREELQRTAPAAP
jgi:protein O-mannosyl-transferase